MTQTADPSTGYGYIYHCIGAVFEDRSLQEPLHWEGHAARKERFQASHTHDQPSSRNG